MTEAIKKAALKTGALSLFIYCFNRRPFATSLTVFFFDSLVIEMQKAERDEIISHFMERRKAAMN